MGTLILLWKKCDEQIGSKFNFEWLLPLEKCSIKTHRFSAILVDDVIQDLEKKEKRLKRNIPLQYLGKVVMKLVQALVEDVIQNAKHQIPHRSSVNVQLHHDLKDLLVLSGWFLLVRGGHVTRAIDSKVRCRMSLRTEICEAYVSFFSMC